MPRVGLSPSAVVDAALNIVDADGLDALTLAAVAQRTGVAAPSLYKHVKSLAELRVLVGIRLLGEMTERFSEAVAGRSGDDAVRALMYANRTYAHEYPARYLAMPLDPLHDSRLAAAGGAIIGIVYATLRQYGLTDAQTVHTTRCLRSAAHGFASLEASGGFGLPEKLDETYDQLIASVLATIPQRRPASGLPAPRSEGDRS